MSKNKEICPEAQERMEDVLDLMIHSGNIPDPRIDDDAARQRKQEKANKVFHNTLLLLQRYRDIIWVLQSVNSEICQELDVPLHDVDALLSSIDIQLSLGNTRIENRLEQVKKNRLLIERLHAALTVLKMKPGDGKRMYDLLYLTYITDEILPVATILYRLSISSRQYYRLRQQAIDIISLQLWTVPGVMGAMARSVGNPQQSGVKMKWQKNAQRWRSYADVM